MSEEEFINALKEWGFDTTFRTLKDKVYYKYCIAGIYHKSIEIIKISKNKCYRNIVKGQGIETSKWATMRNYNADLKSKKYEIIGLNII